MLRSKAVKAGFGYTIGNFLVKGIAFFALPLFGRLMTTEEFGIYSLFASYDAILFVFVGLCVHSSLRAANQEYEGRLDVYASSVSLIYLLGLSVFALLILFFGESLFALLGFHRGVLLLLLLHSLGSALLSFYNDRLSIDYNARGYILLALFNALANVGLSLLLMLTLLRSDRSLGRILGATIAMAAVGLWVLFRLWKKAPPHFDRDFWRFALRYSLPIVPHGVSTVLLSSFDRIMIARMAGESAAGVYSMAANVKLILVVILESVANAFSTWFFEESRTGDHGRIRHAAGLLWGVFAFLFVGICAIGPEVVYLAGGAAYTEGRTVLVPMLLEACALFLYNLIVQTEYVAKKTGFVMAGTGIAAVLNIAMNAWAIAAFGWQAAAWTTLASYLVLLLFHLVVSRRVGGYFVLPFFPFLPILAVVMGMAAVAQIFSEILPVRWMTGAVLLLGLGMWLLWKIRNFNFSDASS